MIFSSGSTGRPKGAMHAHRDLRTSVDGYASAILALEPGDRCHSVARAVRVARLRQRVLPSPGARGDLRDERRAPDRAQRARPRRPGTRSRCSPASPPSGRSSRRSCERHPDPDALRRVRLAVSSGDALPAAVGDQPPRGDRRRADRGARVLGVLEHRDLHTPGRADARRHRAARPRRRDPPRGRRRPARRRGNAGSAVDQEPLQHLWVLAALGRDPRAGLRPLDPHGRHTARGRRRVPPPRSLRRPVQGRCEVGQPRRGGGRAARARGRRRGRRRGSPGRRRAGPPRCVRRPRRRLTRRGGSRRRRCAATSRTGSPRTWRR